MSEYYIIGDIEDGQYSYNDALEVIGIKDNKRIIFLGDMYTHRSKTVSISRIENILNKFGHNITNYIDNFNELSDCQRAIDLFEDIYRKKNIDIYTFNDRFKRDEVVTKIIINDIITSRKITSREVFLFGNKEVEILRDFHAIKGFNVVDNIAIFSYQYSFKHNTYENTLKYNAHDVNVLLTYLSLCRHVFYVYNTIITHMYINSRTITQMKIPVLDIRQTICGHNRCFGKYRDHANPNISIYIVDISHEENHIIKNYIRLRPNELTFFSLDSEASDALKHTMMASKTFLMSFNDIGHSIGAIEFRRSQLEAIKNGYNYKH